MILSEITDSELQSLTALVTKAIAITQNFRFGDICPLLWAKAYPQSNPAVFVKMAEAAIEAVRKHSVTVEVSYSEYQSLLSFVAKAIAFSQGFRFGDVCPIMYSKVHPPAKVYVSMSEAAIVAMRKFGIT